MSNRERSHEGRDEGGWDDGLERRRDLIQVTKLK